MGDHIINKKGQIRADLWEVQRHLHGQICIVYMHFSLLSKSCLKLCLVMPVRMGIGLLGSCERVWGRIAGKGANGDLNYSSLNIISYVHYFRIMNEKPNR